MQLVITKFQLNSQLVRAFLFGCSVHVKCLHSGGKKDKGNVLSLKRYGVNSLFPPSRPNEMMLKYMHIHTCTCRWSTRGGGVHVVATLFRKMPIKHKT